MEEILLMIISILAGAVIIGLIGYTVGMSKQEKIIGDLLLRQSELQLHAAEMAEKNRELMKEMNKKQNVSRETSQPNYTKSYGIPEVMDFFDRQYPSREDKR